MLLTAIVFILMIGLLIFVHEFGHYIVAKKKGIRVEEFAFGFGPKIFSIKDKETLFKINLIPLGGYVKLSDEFENKTVWKRAQVIGAGVLMNLFLGIFLFFIVFAITGKETEIDVGNRQYLVYPQETSIIITEVIEGYPADNKLQPNDQVIIITEVIEGYPADNKLQPNDQVLNFSTIKELQAYIQNHQEQKIILNILRNQEEIEIRIIPNVQGQIGIVLNEFGFVRYPVYRAALNSFTFTGEFIGNIFIFFGDLITGEIEQPAEHIGGPILIFQVVDKIIPYGLGAVLLLIGLLSVFLAIINILPFPVLDGGYLFFLGIEGIRKKPISKKVQNIANSIGFALLMLFFILVIIIDIERLF
ncbi:MAG: hypothetical protein HF967_09590 [Methanosarcinales archaeon]|nr:hypothetical protein [Methanosarcinales archaeon]